MVAAVGVPSRAQLRSAYPTIVAAAAAAAATTGNGIASALWRQLSSKSVGRIEQAGLGLGGGRRWLTTVLCVRKDGEVVIVGDGQVRGWMDGWMLIEDYLRVLFLISEYFLIIATAIAQITQGTSVVKPNTMKIRTIGENAVGGFAGATADALTLFQVSLSGSIVHAHSRASVLCNVCVVFFYYYYYYRTARSSRTTSPSTPSS